MVQNVVTIKRHEKQPYPDLWPKSSLDSVLYALHRNQPAHLASPYHFAVKNDLIGDHCSIIVQANESVLFQAPPKQTLNSPFSRWLTQHTPALKTLSNEGFSGTIVGKMAEVEGVDVFCVYYVIQDGIVYVDAPSIDGLLSAAREMFDDTILAVPVIRIAVVRIDRPNGIIASRDISSLPPSSIVGIPISMLDARMSTDGDEVVGPAFIISSPVHMRYSGFIHTVTNTTRRREDVSA